MSISTRIQAINDHLIDDYSVLTLAGADLTGVNKNVLNLKQSWQERLLYFMNNGTEVVWNNWNKVTGSGTSVSINNTVQAPMSLVYKGNTSQASTPTPSSPQDIHTVSGDNSIEVKGKNYLVTSLSGLKSYNTSGTWNNNVYSFNNLTFTVNDDLSIVVNGTANANTAFFLKGGNNVFVDLSMSNGDYTLSGAVGGALNMATWCIYMAIKHSDDTTTLINSYDGGVNFTKTTGDTFFPLIRINSGTQMNNVKFMPMIIPESDSSSYPINLSSKNLLDMSTLESGYISSTGSVNTGTSQEEHSDYIKVKPNTTYTFKIFTSVWSGFGTNNWFGIGEYVDKAENQFVTRKTSTSLTQDYFTITTGNTTQYVRISARGLVYTTEAQFSEGGEPKTYEKYYNIELNKIGTYQDKIDKSTGKNLFSSNTWRKVYTGNGYPVPNTSVDITITSSDTNNISFNIGQTYAGIESDFIPVKANEEYTLSFKQATNINRLFVTQYDSNKNRIGTINENITIIEGKTFTTTNDGYIAVAFASTSAVNNVVISLIQIEKGSSATTYEPYGTDWYKYGAIGKVVLNGSESWGTVGSVANGFYTDSLTTAYNPVSGSTNIYTYCDKFVSTYRSAVANYDYSIAQVNNGTSTGHGNIIIRNKDITGNINTWLTTNNVTLYYVLSTPTYTKIEDTTLINQLEAMKQSYDSQTNISQTNNDLPFELSVTALGELE